MEILLKIKAAIKGDKQAFNNVINAYERKLYIIARSRLSNNEDIKDAIQETIMFAYINLKKLKDATKFNSWITSILLNICKKIYNQKEEKELELSYDELEENNIHLKGDSDIKSLEENQSFFDIIDFLKPEDRTIISMYYLDGYKTREISIILKLNESTLRSRISSIKEKIRQRYGKED